MEKLLELEKKELEAIFHSPHSDGYLKKWVEEKLRELKEAGVFVS